MAFEPSQGETCDTVLDSAVADRQAKRFAESLDKFVWYFENSRSEPGHGGARLSFALRYWFDLAKEYQPAMDAFISVRDEKEARCRESCGEFKAFHEASALNRFLAANDRTISLFLDVVRRDKVAAKRIYHIVEKYLVAHGLYSECGPFLEVNPTVDKNIQDYKLGKENERLHAEQFPSAPPLAERIFRERIVRLVALLALNDRKSDAELVVERSLSALDTDEFRSELASAINGHFQKN